MKNLLFAMGLACLAPFAQSARAQDIINPSNTVVRFDVFTGGTNFGSIDIELFDQEKPDTVRNFLLYVYSGAYSNLVFHRLEPNFVIQAGHVRVDDPASTEIFSNYPPSIDFGSITNEYGAGQQLTNDFGTIAMARVAGQTNSASVEWFINLKNNSGLDTVDGGFTVFGRVVNTIDDRSGTNLLAYFNTLSAGRGIRSVNIPAYGESLSGLPVGTNRVGAPINADLFTLVPSFIQERIPRDNVAPTMTVLSPADTNVLITTNSILILSGTAADNQAVACVLYDTSSESSLVASGKENWSVELALQFGTNRFAVHSVDYFGNVSSTVERVIVVVEPPPDPNHTVVRFAVFTGGTNFGSIDIELFDQEKPETVRNFLMYVYSGAYSNLVFHRLDANFVIQAGHVRVEDAASTNIFSNYPPSAYFGNITNEFGVGPRWTNNFGTIAMARVGGQTNSASTDWYINLNNNSGLDTVDGGFTVFGRVVNTIDDRSGTNLLAYFNSLSVGRGIRSVNFPEYGESLSSLPVGTNRAGAPIIADLFTIVPSFIQGGSPRDNVAPTVTVLPPADTNVLITTNSILTLSGTAADNQEIARVLYDTSSESSLVASGKENWSVELRLDFGTNHFAVRSVDYFGNVSPAVERVIVLVADPNHTIVRFGVFNGAANFGNMDIELFDQEKPETVRNFLIYVYSGAYSNLVLHDLLPNQKLQAGHVRINDPSGTNLFLGYTRSPNFGHIVNESELTPPFSNEFGTIAMARTPGETNSASNEWFINLTNNASSNTNGGGFTVFGRVRNTPGARSGTNLLGYFNTFRNGVNIRQVTPPGTGESFAVPVTQYRSDRPPITSEMFLLRASFLHGGLLRDSVAPIVQVNDPSSGAVIITTNSTITFSGTAADNQEVARVLYDAPAGAALRVDGRENWTASVPLVAGTTNQITVRAVDYFGNVGAATRTVFFTHTRPVDFSIQGIGKVIGITDGQSLLVGVSYTLVAKPSARQFFLGWRSGNDIQLSAQPTFNFTMQEDTTNITAVFSRTLLGITNGAYRGLFLSGTNGPSSIAGLISINVAPNGSYSGRLTPLGSSYAIRGKFDSSGNTGITGRRGSDTLTLQLSLASTESILGTYSDGRSLSSVGLWHVEKFTRANPAPRAGIYTFLISPTLDTQLAAVSGYGFGSVVVDTLGRIRMTGTLADQTPIRQTSAMLAGELWPFFASAKRGSEVVLGMAGFANSNVFIADLKWFSPAFPGKTNQNAGLSGSSYVPGSEARLFNWTNGVIALSGGGLETAIFANVLLNEGGAFEIPFNPHNIELGVPDAAGGLVGSFTHPVTSALTPLRGAVLQSSNMAAGFFPGGTSSGAFTIRQQ